MKKIRFVIADTDENYAAQIQHRLLSLLSNAAEINIITDRNLLLDYFETPRKIDALLIDKSLYFRAIEKHNIDMICVLTDNPEDCKAVATGFISNIYRYSSIENITEKLMSGINRDSIFAEKSGSKCKVILVASPLGGCGKTVSAVGISAALKKSGKEVLFVDTTNLQTASFWVNGRKKTKDDLYILDNLNTSDFKNIIVHSQFDFIIPFSQTLPAMGVTLEIYVQTVESIKSKESYDYIVIDSSSDFSIGLTKLMSISDHVILLTLQDRVSAYKFRRFLNSIDYSDADKFMLCCSFYRYEKKSDFDGLPENIQVSEYIPMANFGEESNLEQIGNMKCYKQIAAMLIKTGDEEK